MDCQYNKSRRQLSVTTENIGCREFYSRDWFSKLFIMVDFKNYPKRATSTITPIVSTDSVIIISHFWRTSTHLVMTKSSLPPPASSPLSASIVAETEAIQNFQIMSCWRNARGVFTSINQSMIEYWTKLGHSHAISSPGPLAGDEWPKNTPR